jgi:glycosidase
VKNKLQSYDFFVIFKNLFNRVFFRIFAGYIIYTKTKYTMKKLFSYLFLAVFTAFMLVSCTCSTSKNQCQLYPEWSKSATIYEVNLRQFTEEGTIAAFKEHLPRLKELGVDILWFMPIHPIGELDRKGTLGSYYSVRDYRGINPEFGTEQDFKDLVKEIHKLGMKVILDLVPNHTARDHKWVTEHPEFYVWGNDGTPLAPFDWSDVAQLDWKNCDVWKAMLGDMLYQIKEWNIDGFRCDVAGMVPVQFWEMARVEMNKIKPVFMLAEDDDWKVFLDRAFEANYAWHFSNELLNGIAQGRRNVQDLMNYHERNQKITPRRAYRLMFTSNHDENSWVDTEFKRMGVAYPAMAVLSFTFESSFPLIYSGQEVGFDKKLEFFEKDEIIWDDQGGWTKFYQTLTSLKRNNEALWNGEFGGRMVRINTNEQDKVFAFVREKNGNSVFTILNLSKDVVNITLESDRYVGDYIEVFSNSKQNFAANQHITLKPWEYKVFVK